MHEDIKWLFGLILVFGAFWFAAGGIKSASQNSATTPPPPADSVQTYGPDFSHIGKNSSTVVYYGGTAQNQNAPNKQLTTTDEISQGLRDAGVEASQIKQELAALELASHTSPLHGKLAIAGISASQTSPVNEYIVLRAFDSNTEKILISGLRLQSVASGNGTDIKNGAYLPLQNSINREEPIYLGPGEMVYIISGRSPLGMSFRLNECTGFFNQYQSFIPSLPMRCPSPQTEPLPPPSTQYNDQCLDYIGSLPGCLVIINPPPNISPECTRYVTTELNYTKCLDRHKNDLGFYSPEWRVYLGRDETLWKSRRELINLLDQNNKVIDAITY